MTSEQELANFEVWLKKHPDYRYFESYEIDYMLVGWQAALESSEVQALRKDVARLDWLDAQAHCADWVDNEPTKRVIRAEDGEEFTGDTWRAAIDAAMKGQS